MGGGAQGRVEHAASAADACWLTRDTFEEVGQGHNGGTQRPHSTLDYGSGAVVFCAGTDEQADAGDLAVCPAAAGLLAAGKDGGCRVASDR